MVVRYKVGVLEVDGVDLEDMEERPLDADNIYFDNTGAITTDDNLQDAVFDIDARSYDALNAPIFPIILQHNGTVSNGTFFGYSNLIPGDDTPIIVPKDSLFTIFTFSNKRSTADYTIEFRKNTTGGTAFLSVAKTNTKSFSFELGSPESFVAGDEIFVKYVDNGRNATDVGITLNFRALP